MNLRALTFVATLFAATPLAAAPVITEHAEAELVAEHTAWVAGGANEVALRLKPEAGWHTYWRNPGDSGIATSLAWTLPAGWKAGAIQWPYPSVQMLGDIANYGYGEETLHLVALEAPASLQGTATVKALAKWLVCKDICIPGQAALSLTLPVASIATANPRWAPRFADARARLPAPELLPAIFAIADREVRVQISLPTAIASEPHPRIEFFPYANNLVNHGAPQRVAVEHNVARIAQAQSPYLPGMPEAVEGLVVVDGTTTVAYAFKAVRGEVAAVPTSAAAAALASETPPATAAAPSAAAPAPATDEPSLLLVLGFALLGGLILNLMPCVFPVLSLKAVSVLESRRGDSAAERAHALAYTAGVVLSCMSVALALALFRVGGERLGWGFQLQSPVFVALLAYLMFALGLSLSGLVQFGTQLMGVGQGLTELHGYAGSFFTGVLAVVVASPCVAPFMGTALGFALTQSTAVALLIFATLGLGLASPFLLLGFFPALGGFLPRPGAWMETFKQVLAFPLYLTAVWLLWVLGRQTGIDAVAFALSGMVLLAFALWLWQAPARGGVRAFTALLAFAAAAALLAHPAIRTKKAQSEASATAEARVPFSEEKLATLRAQGKAVFINFTADWCLSCKVNEKVVFENEDVKKAVEDSGIVWMTGDWTNGDPEITRVLGQFGRGGVPLYMLYPRKGEPEILPQILTPQLMVDAIRRATAS